MPTGLQRPILARPTPNAQTRPAGLRRWNLPCQVRPGRGRIQSTSQTARPAWPSLLVAPGLRRPFGFFGNRVRDHIFFRGPVAEIDEAAAFATERHLRISELHRLAADRTLERAFQRGALLSWAAAGSGPFPPGPAESEKARETAEAVPIPVRRRGHPQGRNRKPG